MIPRRLSRLHPGKPVFAFTPSPATLNVLALTWGIRPLQIPFVDHTDGMTAQVDRLLREEGLAETGDLTVIVAGSPPGTPGSTNTLKIHRIGDLDD